MCDDGEDSGKGQEKKSNLVSFDRLTPRRKRKRSGEEEDGEEGGVAEKKGKKEGAGASTRKEYQKLKELVPALSVRDSLTKVEIIEETIRYIDALQHQVAAKITVTQTSATDTESDQGTTSSSQSRLKLVPTEKQDQSSDTQNQNIPSTSSATPSTSAKDSPADIKNAVENIQALFRLYLEEQQQQSSSSDDS